MKASVLFSTHLFVCVSVCVYGYKYLVFNMQSKNWRIASFTTTRDQKLKRSNDMKTKQTDETNKSETQKK